MPAVDVRLDDAFWAPRLETHRAVTLEAVLERCASRIENFDRAAGSAPGGHQGRRYDDSDVYKTLEGVAYTLALHPDRHLQGRGSQIVERIAAAQHEDGYLNTYVTLLAPRRWDDARSGHELYCAGHLIEAALAWVQVTGQRTLLDVALRLADHIVRTFGPSRRVGPPGHQEIELALLKLAEATGRSRYARLACFFLEQRGRIAEREGFGEYCQDHLPVREQVEAKGHAVRAMYQACALAAAIEATGDRSLLGPLELCFRDVVERKMYVTGGIGSSAHNEGFTDPFDLPNESAYCETCASIGMALWSHRMLLLTRQTRYADALELQLYNNLLAGVSLGGDRFFYDNPMASRGEHERQPWFDCACCPTNLVRYLPGIGERFYAYGGDDLYVLLYASGVATVPLLGGAVRLRQTTGYPWDGEVEIAVDPACPVELALHLRVPGWCVGPVSWSLNGGPVRCHEPTRPGWLTVRRKWSAGDTVSIDLPMPARRVYADPRVRSNQGHVAIQRGPIVYALEGIDHPGRSVHEVLLPASAKLRTERRPDLLGGVTVVRADGPTPVFAVPYATWGNRGRGEMRVWIPERGPASQ